jgi:putative hydrolase of the HAD superfamily
VTARETTAWVFDLDNTLYPAECDLFAQIDRAMTAYVSHLLGLEREEALAVQKRYYLEHGTTLAGLIAQHAADPHAFLEAVHDIDYSPIAPDPELRGLLLGLPGRRFVFTNGSRKHAARVVERLGLEGVFDGLFAIEDAELAPKPMPEAFDRLCIRYAIDPAEAVFFDDLVRNIAAAKALGFTTVLVRSGKDWSREPHGARPAGPQDAPGAADHVSDGLKPFLRGLKR